MDNRRFEQTLSHTSQRGLSCSVAWLRPAGRLPPGSSPPAPGRPTASAAQPFQDGQKEAAQRFTMWPDLTGLALGETNLPSTFMVIKQYREKEI